ncbi:MFS transporter [Litoribacillus peritrichatus]|uniref:MFS transporter n=1 Tax=Litoribacillus peritrichatus TaxID=718191 RepID=A0ABP7NAS3_9GAMM
MPLISNRFLFVLLTSLYFSQGFPSGLLAHGMPAIMREYGSSLTSIGMLKLLALPWLFKFLWAPLLDKYHFSRLGPHRSWIMVMQTGAVLTLFGLSWFDPAWLFAEGLILLFILLFLVNLFSSTQDVATDGLAVTLLPERLRGLGNSIQVCGYKVGLMLGGSGLLVLINDIGWSLSIQLVALTLMIMLLPTLRFNEIATFKALDQNSEKTASATDQPLGGYNFWQFFKTPNIMRWVGVLVTFKVIDSFSSTLVKPMLIDFQLSLAEVGEITFIASLIGLAGALLAGALYSRLNSWWLLMGFTVLQMFAVAAYAILPGLHQTGDSSFMTWVYVIVGVDQAIDTMATVVLFAVMMGHCRKQHEGGDYTVQACLQVFAAGLVGVLAGVMGDWIQDYQVMFMVSGLSGVLAILALVLYRPVQVTKLPL